MRMQDFLWELEILAKSLGVFLAGLGLWVISSLYDSRDQAQVGTVEVSYSQTCTSLVSSTQVIGGRMTSIPSCRKSVCLKKEVLLGSSPSEDKVLSTQEVESSNCN